MHSFIQSFPIWFKSTSVLWYLKTAPRAPTALSDTENLKQAFMNMNSYEQKRKLLASLVEYPVCQAVLQAVLAEYHHYLKMLWAFVLLLLDRMLISHWSVCLYPLILPQKLKGHRDLYLSMWIYVYIFGYNTRCILNPIFLE